MARLTKVFSTGKVLRKIVLIFLTVGTWRKGFDRLVKSVDELIGSGIINDEVIAQIGYSSYSPKHMTVMKFFSPDGFAETISKARIVISHAGMGVIIEVVKQAKPLIVVPRKSTLGEVDNDHQFTTAKQFETEGIILVAYEVDKLPDKLKEAEKFVPAQGQDSKGILQAVQEFIDDLS